MNPPIKPFRIITSQEQALVRARRWALLSTMRDLRHSVLRRRPITLPNLLRIYRRRCHRASGEADLSGPGDDRGVLFEDGQRWLLDLYQHEQPFRQTRWRSWRPIRQVLASLRGFEDPQP
jgi:hypothetical protein